MSPAPIIPPPTPGTFSPRITSDVDASGWTDVDSATGRTWSTRLNEPGEGELKVPVADATSAAKIVLNRPARFSIDGTPRFAGRIKPQHRDIITRGGSPRWLEAKVPGILSEWADAPVLAAFGPAVAPTSSTRTFNWACNEIDDSTWGSGWDTVAAVIGSDGRPWTFPDPVALRIWKTGATTLYARRRLSVTAGDITPIYGATAGPAQYWVGGIKVMDGETAPMPSDEFARRVAPQWASTGDAVYGITSTELDGEAWIAAAIYGITDILTDEINTSTFLSHTGLVAGPLTPDPWKVSATPVGPTPGRIIRALLVEAQALGLLTGWTLDFDDDDDSNGNAWDTVTEISFAVGSTLLEALMHLAELEIDFSAPVDGTRVLSAYRWRERGTFHTSPGTRPKLSGERYGTISGRLGNISELSHEYQDAPPTRLHVRWAEGTFFLGSGNVMRSVDLSRYSSVEAATAAAQRIIDGGDSDAVGTSVVVAVQPRNGDDQPFVHYDIGDAVDCPDETGGIQTYRCVGITVESTSSANPRYAVELAEPLSEVSSRAWRWLNRVQPGGMGGLVEASSSTGDLISGVITGKLSEIRTIAFNLSGDVVVSESDPWPAGQRVRMYRFSAALTTAGSTDTVIEIRRNGTAVHTITFPSTYTEHDGFMGGIYLVKGDVLTAAVTTAGTGAEGLVVECFATEAI